MSRPKSKFCSKGHLMSETRVSYSKGNDHCRICAKINSKNWVKKHPEQVSKYSRRSKIENGYGLPIEEYEKMLKKCKGKCEICGRVPDIIDNRTGLPRNLHIDHDHETDEVRGLLCSRCNTAIGSLGEDINVVKKLLVYLKKWKVSKV